MTVPVFGHADFQTDLPWRSGNLFTSYTQVYPIGVTNGAIFPTLGWSALRLRFTLVTGGGRLTVNWFADSGGAQAVGSDTWAVTTTTWLTVAIPIEGAFVQLSFNNTTGGTDTANQYAVLAQTSVTKLEYPVSGTMAAGSAVSIAASGTLTDSPLFIAKGHGHIRILPGDALGKINASLETRDEQGSTVAILYQNNGFTAEQHFDFPYPDGRIRIAFTNTDAGAAHSITYALWCDDD